MSSVKTRGRAERQQGSATVLVLGCVLAACLLCGWWITAGRAGVARQHAETAADLAALAAANSAARSDGNDASPCAAAARVAFANGARLESCRLDVAAGESLPDVEVTVVVSAPVTARSTARAGPQADL